MLSAAVVAVKGLPSAQVTPSARVRVTVVPSTDHFLASWDSTAPDFPLTETRVSYASWLTVNSALPAEDCGSSLPGSPLSAMVNVAPSAYLGLPSSDFLSPSSPPHPARRVAVTQRPRAVAVSFIAV